LPAPINIIQQEERSVFVPFLTVEINVLFSQKIQVTPCKLDDGVEIAEF
jgi:hypothetical protein